MKKSTMKTMGIAAISALGIGTYMYMKKNPEVMRNMKHMVKGMAKKTYEMMNDVD